jgi:hypothetical protein
LEQWQIVSADLYGGKAVTPPAQGIGEEASTKAQNLDVYNGNGFPVSRPRWAQAPCC